MTHFSSFDPLFESSATLDYVGSFFHNTLKKICGERIIDILYHCPTQVKFYNICNNLREFFKTKADENGKVFVKAKVIPAYIESNVQKVVLVCRHEELMLELVFFNSNKHAVLKMFPLNQESLICGELTQFKGIFNIVQPKKIYALNKEELIYPLTKGLVLSAFSRILYEAFKIFNKNKEYPDWIDAQTLSSKGWPTFYELIQNIHNPNHSFKAKNRERLAFDELLAHQLSLLIAKGKFDTKTDPLTLNGDMQTHARSLLPYELTPDQQTVLTQLKEDLEKDRSMNRLLQGDVGSGKTIVAFLSMLDVVELGYQCALLAPTEILAQQHFESLTPLAEKLGVSLGLFLGAHTKSQKNKNAANLQNGTIQIAIGTHALFQEGVEFQNLKYIIIDEQHRFGVEQRLNLRDKGNNPHMLMMTATPIPRTSVMVQYGDINLSFLKNKPKNRKMIHTSVIDASKEQELIAGIERILDKGNQVYWVCPLIEESENLDLANVNDRYESLKNIFGDKVALLHGKMKSAQKDEIMKNFQDNICKILVTTTVIEVGVNIPNATIMIIENAQRFGLSQLHQLRGRVGRGADQSYCVLMHNQTKGDSSKRLEIMKSCDDGFELSQMDLKLRGRGDILGTQQSGFKSLRFFEEEAHESLISVAVKYANTLYQQKQQGKIEPLILLELFRRKEDYRGV